MTSEPLWMRLRRLGKPDPNPFRRRRNANQTDRFKTVIEAAQPVWKDQPK